MTQLTLTEIYLKLPWTIQPSLSEDTGARVLRVAELPEFLVVEAAGRSLERDFWDALRGLIESYQAHGETPPLPRGVNIERILAGLRPRPALAAVPSPDQSVTFGGTFAQSEPQPA